MSDTPVSSPPPCGAETDCILLLFCLVIRRKKKPCNTFVHSSSALSLSLLIHNPHVSTPSSSVHHSLHTSCTYGSSYLSWTARCTTSLSPSVLPRPIQSGTPRIPRRATALAILFLPSGKQTKKREHYSIEPLPPSLPLPTSCSVSGNIVSFSAECYCALDMPHSVTPPPPAQLPSSPHPPPHAPAFPSITRLW